MATSAPARPALQNLAELLERLGGVPPERVRLHPPPGTATEADVLRCREIREGICELVEGVLVEKPMGYFESWVTLILSQLLVAFVRQHDLGIVTGADGTLRLAPGLVRIPDLAFIGWDRFPDRQLPAEPIPDLVPDLAVEVLSESNTEQEMENKLKEYFAAGVRLVWYAAPESRTVRVYTSPTELRLLSEEDTLDGGAVLPGFQLRLRDWFDAAGQRQER